MNHRRDQLKQEDDKFLRRLDALIEEVPELLAVNKYGFSKKHMLWVDAFQSNMRKLFKVLHDRHSA